MFNSVPVFPGSHHATVPPVFLPDPKAMLGASYRISVWSVPRIIRSPVQGGVSHPSIHLLPVQYRASTGSVLAMRLVFFSRRRLHYCAHRTAHRPLRGLCPPRLLRSGMRWQFRLSRDLALCIVLLTGRCASCCCGFANYSSAI